MLQLQQAGRRERRSRTELYAATPVLPSQSPDCPERPSWFGQWAQPQDDPQPTPARGAAGAVDEAPAADAPTLENTDSSRTAPAWPDGHSAPRLDSAIERRTSKVSSQVLQLNSYSGTVDTVAPVRHHGEMQFSKDAMPGIIDGSITVTFRGWKRAQAKAAGRHRIWGQLIEIDDVRVIGASEVTDDDAVRAGASSAAAVLSRIGDTVDGRIFRIQFHHVGEDDRVERRNDAELSDDRRTEIQRRLDRMDRSSGTGPWTTKALRLIATFPGVVSTALARQMDADRPAFKINVRKLKELGLTESLEIGYRLSPLGEAFTGMSGAPSGEQAGDQAGDPAG
jgi:hypothetical protein